MCILRFSLWKVLHTICGYWEYIYSVGKDLVKQTWQISQIECFASISREGLTRKTLVKTPGWHDFSSSSHVLYTWLISWVSFSRASCEIHLFIILNLSLPTLSHSSLTIWNPHTYSEIWLKKLQSNLARN